MKHNLARNQNGTAALQAFAMYQEPGTNRQVEVGAGGSDLPPAGPGNLAARIRRQLAGLGQADLEEALLKGLAWGNGRGLR